jgi:hypothetical protein
MSKRLRQLLTLCSGNCEDAVRWWTRWPQNVRKLSREMFNKITNTVHKYIIYLQEEGMYVYIFTHFRPSPEVTSCTPKEVLKTFRLLITTQLELIRNDIFTHFRPSPEGTSCTPKEVLKTFRLLITTQLELIRNDLYRFIRNIHLFAFVNPRWYTTIGYSNSQDNDIMTIMTILP